jgi:hypothetical protein
VFLWQSTAFCRFHCCSAVRHSVKIRSIFVAIHCRFVFKPISLSAINF